ncbi:type II toxin-antitoxin system VapC family toxin [Spirosoma sp.]|uniref:type II toxin-antitoxin system VapC family toxin n=1 Tax=Spirosoma sp. TaxID=1899569 RepID=UPI003B3BBA8D
MILDSNILIYAVEPASDVLRTYLFERSGQLYVSLISKLEVLGYHRLQPDHKADLEKWLDVSFIFPITDDIITEAIRLRQLRKRSLADSIIAATGLLYNQPILTNNSIDFSDIEGLEIIVLTDILRQ